MLLYSKTINSFLARLYAEAREILTHEVGLSVQRRRFLWKRYYYPLNIVVFERVGELGYFDPNGYQIGLHRQLLYQATPEVLKNILRHELAHYLTYLQFGHTDRVHGKEFHDVCRSYGWGPEVWKASSHIVSENQKANTTPAVLQVLERVQKLLKLAESSNSHEAELATAKANQLLLKYNLEHLSAPQQFDQDEMVYVKRVLSGKRYNGKWRAIYHILTQFFVQPVVNHGRELIYLEVLGDQLNVELADYVAKFLDHELEFLWKKARQANPRLKGLASKNSFYRGLAQAFVDKMQAQKTALTGSAQALVKLEKALHEKVKLAYPRLGHASSAGLRCFESELAGQKAGHNLSINPALKQNTAQTYLLN